jgi:predicted SnoaL-like aldol condensation-catalyzing enzyme
MFRFENGKIAEHWDSATKAATAAPAGKQNPAGKQK